MDNWESIIRGEWEKRVHEARKPSERLFPLIAQSFDSGEVLAAVDCLLSGQITMSKKVREFEKKFAEVVGAPYAVMVNSGSSANLLAMAAAANPARKSYLKRGDQVLVPSVCWSTSVWPIIQMGLEPVFVDVDPQTLNISLRDLQQRVTPRTKGMVAVHILGNSAEMKTLLGFCQERNLLLIEDTCESLGSQYQKKFLGSFGHFGTFSFYYSHHITTGEGGMVACHTEEDYDLLKCLRAHGWTRELSNRQELEAKFSEIDSRFLFVNVGYNFRPMEIQAAFGMCQLKKMPEMNSNRNQNHARLTKALTSHSKWKEQLHFIRASDGTNPAWFGFPCLLHSRYKGEYQNYLHYLSEQGVENRPIVSGNFTRQPGLKLFDMTVNPKDYPGAEAVGELGFFIGLHTDLLSDSLIAKLSDILLGYDFS